MLPLLVIGFHSPAFCLLIISQFASLGNPRLMKPESHRAHLVYPRSGERERLVINLLLDVKHRI